jgi:purine-binding chemotaxis protein CheW
MTAPAPAAPLGGKYLTFGLGDEEYGVAVLKVREIIGMQPVTRVPRTPAFIRGVINLRGAVIPVMDLRERFGMPPAGGEVPAELRCIVVTQVAGPDGRPLLMGVVVDRVSEVAAVADADVGPAPSFGPRVRTEYLLGVAAGAAAGAEGGRVRLLLDIDRVLAADELAELASA